MTTEEVSIAAGNQPAITMGKINETKTASTPKESTQKASTRSGGEEMSAQSDTYLPNIANPKDIAIEDKASAIKKHPALATISGKTKHDLKAAYPDIPESILKELGSQSEAVIAISKPHVATDKKSANVKYNIPFKTLPSKTKDDLPHNPFSRDNPAHASFTAKSTKNATEPQQRIGGSFSAGSVPGVDTDADDTPYSSMGDLSVEDKAKLMAQQLKAARS